MSPTVAAGRLRSPIAPFAPSVRYEVAEPTAGEGALGGNVAPSEFRPPYTFSTDRNGYRRNPLARDANPELLVLGGDSFIFGAHLSDDETLPVALTRELGVDAYNLGRPSTSSLTVPDLDALLGRFRERPCLAVLVHLEQHRRKSPRHAASEFTPRPRDEEAGLIGLARRARRLGRSLVSFWSVSPFKNELRYAYRKLNDGTILPNVFQDRVAMLDLPDGRPMIFRSSELDPVTLPRDETTLRSTADYLEWWNEVLALRGMRTVVLLMPTRYTVYAPFLTAGSAHDAVAGANGFMRGLESELERRGMRVVNALSIFQPTAREELATGELSFYREDNHWNPRGVERVASALARTLREQTVSAGCLSSSVAAASVPH